MKFVILTTGSVRSTLAHRPLSLGVALVRRGHSVTLITPSVDKYNNFTHDHIQEVDGVVIKNPYQFKTRSTALNMIPYLFSASIEVLRQRADVVWMYKLTPLTIVGILAKWLRGVPLIVDTDDIDSDVMKAERLPKWQIRLVEWCEALSTRYSDGFFAASSFLERRLGKQRPGAPILRIPNGVDSGSLNDNRFVTQNPQFIFLGNLNRRGIMGPVLRAFASVKGELPQAKMIIAGDGSQRSYLQRAARRLGIAKQVSFIGWTPFEELSHYTLPGDIGICWMPASRSAAACSNQKVFQYMALGLVPLVSKVGDLPEYVDHGRVGFIAGSSTDEIAKTLIAAIQSPSLAEKSAAARHRAASRYDWQILAARIEAFCDDLIAARARRSWRERKV